MNRPLLVFKNSKISFHHFGITKTGLDRDSDQPEVGPENIVPLFHCRLQLLPTFLWRHFWYVEEINVHHGHKTLIIWTIPNLSSKQKIIIGHIVPYNWNKYFKWWSFWYKYHIFYTLLFHLCCEDLFYVWLFTNVVQFIRRDVSFKKRSMFKWFISSY